MKKEIRKELEKARSESAKTMEMLNKRLERAKIKML